MNTFNSFYEHFKQNGHVVIFFYSREENGHVLTFFYSRVDVKMRQKQKEESYISALLKRASFLRTGIICTKIPL